MSIVLPSLPESVAELPMVRHLEEFVSLTLSRHKVLVEAPPGSGKTTLIPLCLPIQSWCKGKKVIVLQPRRLAARNVALRMAELSGGTVGGRVGFRMRLETKVSPATEIEVITEGLLLNRLLEDPSLEEIGAVVLDEFHERSLNSDLILAMLHEVTDTLRPDLRIIVMSASLGKHCSELLIGTHGYARISCEVPPFPLSTSYIPRNAHLSLEENTIQAISSALTATEHGDLLVFLPGSGEIRRVYEKWGSVPHQTKGDPSVTLLQLYGDLPYHEQKQVLADSSTTQQSAKNRRVILATNIAETSLTIRGVRVVIDSGYHKVMRINPASCIPELITERISLDSAVQRAGRAAREGAGQCYRMWSPDEHKALRPEREPEILRSDLSSALLTVLAWGARSVSEFSWITPPGEASALQGIKILSLLGLITSQSQITKEGRMAVALGCTPRLACIALQAVRHGMRGVGAALLSFLETASERGQRGSISADILRRDDFNARLKDRTFSAQGSLSPKNWEDRITRTLGEATDDQQTSSSVSLPVEDSIALLLAYAFPDQIARRRADAATRYLLANGIGANVREGDPLCKSEWIVVCSLRGVGSTRVGDSAILLGTPLPERLVKTHLEHLLQRETRPLFNQSRGELSSVTTLRLGAITVNETTKNDLSPSERHSGLLQYLTSDQGYRALPWREEVQRELLRLNWAKRYGGYAELPECSDVHLQRSVDEWLGPFIPLGTSLKELNPTTLISALHARVPWDLLEELKRTTPHELILPTGKRRPINYTLPSNTPSQSDSSTTLATGSAFVEATVQELLGVTTSPLLGRTKIPLTFEILSPARRPIQRTNDLFQFWKGSYQEVRKEFRGRYPKHRWPEDPLKEG